MVYLRRKNMVTYSEILRMAKLSRSQHTKRSCSRQRKPSRKLLTVSKLYFSIYRFIALPPVKAREFLPWCSHAHILYVL